MDPRFAHVDHWIFDLDNSLYPASCDLFALIDERMTNFVEQLHGCDREEARRVQKAHFHQHGTTLAGLIGSHGVDPHEFLRYVHDIPLDRLSRDDRLVAGVAQLPGRKWVFTNGDRDYAGRVLGALGLEGAFDGLFDIHALEYVPKPDPRGYRLLCDRFGIEPAKALFVEDMARNLVPAKALGMTTVWVDNGSEAAERDADWAAVDYTVRDVGEWLEEILEA